MRRLASRRIRGGSPCRARTSPIRTPARSSARSSSSPRRRRSAQGSSAGHSATASEGARSRAPDVGAAAPARYLGVPGIPDVMAAALEAEIAPIRELVKQHRFAEALRALDALGPTHADHCELLYL